jgi:heme-degrading monooxygenase HmoA
MDLPWSAAEMPPADLAGRDALVMASKFELTSGWRSPAFLTQAIRAWRQARRSPGVLGVSLRAQPLQRAYWTLSAWTDEAALQAFARTEPHRTIMRKVRPWARTATFRFWTTPAGDVAARTHGPQAARALWAEAERRISAPDPGSER